ncbi:hypothetical protein BD410DRAFT_799572 [Rickenella mellea]|uniref:Uncharacterized protein n=1 Tax=Rickenella mellea TaxID=50990 RepID=A0A4Y7QJA0_9AGAM|nr:hypothetical protein BD410DRAFT_799572 [Rickenella mellea]
MAMNMYSEAKAGGGWLLCDEHQTGLQTPERREWQVVGAEERYNEHEPGLRETRAFITHVLKTPCGICKGAVHQKQWEQVGRRGEERQQGLNAILNKNGGNGGRMGAKEPQTARSRLSLSAIRLDITCYISFQRLAIDLRCKHAAGAAGAAVSAQQERRECWAGGCRRQGGEQPNVEITNWVSTWQRAAPRTIPSRRDGPGGQGREQVPIPAILAREGRVNIAKIVSDLFEEFYSAPNELKTLRDSFATCSVMRLQYYQYLHILWPFFAWVEALKVRKLEDGMGGWHWRFQRREDSSGIDIGHIQARSPADTTITLTVITAHTAASQPPTTSTTAHELAMNADSVMPHRGARLPAGTRATARATATATEVQLTDEDQG